MGALYDRDVVQRPGPIRSAIEAAQRAWDAWPDWFIAVWAMVEFVEAAARLGQVELGVEPLRRITASASVGGSNWALGVAARSQALLSEGSVAENFYRRAIEYLGNTRLRPELARAHLVYGEWLRRENRRVDGRTQLQLAHSMFELMGADGFAERARRELIATGAVVRQRCWTVKANSRTRKRTSQGSLPMVVPTPRLVQSYI